MTTVLERQEVELPGLGLQAHVLRGGSGSPLVFLHGPGGIVADDPVVVALAARHDLVAPVHPGFRDLDDINELRDVHDLALYYDDLLDALGLDSVAVVGHSFGAMLAAELAAHVPRRVSRLILAAPLGLWRDEEPSADLFAAYPLGLQDLVWADPGSEAALRYTSAISAQAVHEENVDDPVLAMLLGMAKGMTTLGKYLWPLPDKGLRRRLYRIRAPTLVVWGAKDRFVPASYADDFRAGIADVRVKILDDAGHMAPFEQLDAFVALVEEFLGETV